MESADGSVLAGLREEVAQSPQPVSWLSGGNLRKGFFYSGRHP